MGQLPNNNKSIEMQTMKRLKISLPNEFLEEFFTICSFQESFVGSLGSDASLSSSAVAEPSISLPKNHVRCVFNTSEISELKEFFSTLRISW